MPGDPVKVASNNYKLVAEDDRVRVLEYRGRPGDKTAMHAHPALVAVAITAAKVKFTMPGGETAEAELKEGEAAIFPAVEHTTENIGTSAAHIILVELK